MTTPTSVSSPPAPTKRGPVKAVFLVGFMGAGKTSVGSALAGVLGWRFVDLDARIVERTGRSVAEIFEQDGESSFRKMENDELQRLLAELDAVNTVASLGGGAWMQAANVAALQDADLPVLFLDAPVEELWQRCLPEQGTRPLLQSQDAFRRLYETRRAAYQEATLRVDTQGRTVEEVARHITLLLGLAGTSATT
jgi:shikimate kinase